MELKAGLYEYQQKKETYRYLASQTKLENATELFNSFLKQFNDGHLFVYERPEVTETSMRRIKEIQQNNRLSLAEIESRLKLSNQHKIFGVWVDDSTEYAIIAHQNKFNAYVIKSDRLSDKLGDLKASLTYSNGFKGFFINNNVINYIEASLFKESTLLSFGPQFWRRKESNFKRELSAYNQQNIQLPTVQKLDKDNVLFTIPSFGVNYAQFKQIVTDNFEQITKTKNLIIDIRGNRGGNALYFMFFDPFMNQDIPSSQGHVLASKDNEAYFEKQLRYSKEIYEPLVNRIRSNYGRIVDGPLYKKIENPNVTSKIEQVAILTDHACMSAAESFILHAKSASSKITVFGSPTAGVIDYTSVNVVSLTESGSQRMYFGYPTSSYHKYIPANGYNQTGIIPDVPIDIVNPDKVQFIIDYYQKRNN